MVTHSKLLFIHTFSTSSFIVSRRTARRCLPLFALFTFYRNRNVTRTFQDFAIDDFLLPSFPCGCLGDKRIPLQSESVLCSSSYCWFPESASSTLSLTRPKTQQHCFLFTSTFEQVSIPPPSGAQKNINKPLVNRVLLFLFLFYFSVRAELDIYLFC